MPRKPRSLEILLALGGFALAWLRLRRRRPEELPQRFKRTIEGLGTTFIKLGQLLSLRMDLLPREYRIALEQLQQQVAPFPGAQARAIVERALGRPVDEVFATFEDEPMAAASVAQVHRARMPDGREVVVKVRRPGIVPQIKSDIRLLRRVLRIAAALWPALARQRPLSLVDELSEQLNAEIDFRHEARNMRRLAEVAAHEPDIAEPADAAMASPSPPFRPARLGNPDAVWMPGVIEPLVAEDVLVQECSPGHPLDASYGTPEGARLASVLLDAYLHQFFVVGAYHADPHPGNLFVLPDRRLCFHDFGQIGTLDRRARRALAEMLEAVAVQDARATFQSAVVLGVLEGTPDRLEYERGIEEILSEMAGQPLADWSIAETLWRIARLGRGEHFRLPRHLLILLRTLLLVESTTRALNPQFKLADELMARREPLRGIIESSSRDSLSLVGRQIAQGARALPGMVARWLHEAQTDDGRPGLSVHHRGLETLQAEIARTGNRLALAMVTLGLYVAGSVLMLHAAGPRVLGDLPVFALAAFAGALYLSARLVRAVARSGKL
ncbi:MAG TPA: AarF/UbiB family protein [Xanthomonadaceae bacterium]|nr:AarF/UbiB family protein [Xanthomonadaceae bacterium]